MNEIELLSELRGDVAVRSEPRLAAVRERVLEAIADSPVHPPTRRTSRRDPRSSGRHLRRALLAASVGAAVALVAGGIYASGQHVPAGGRSPGGPAPVAIGPYQLTAQVLRAAALSAASRPVDQPAAEQWIYSKVVDDQRQGGVSASESWIRFDGTQEAYMQGGQLVVHRKAVPLSRGANALAVFAEELTPESAYAALASLPQHRQPLLDAVDTAVAANPESVAPPGGSPATGSTRPELEFDFLTELMWNSAQASPPAADAAVFRALATIPGVTAQPRVTDAVGRPSIALSDTGSEQQLLLDPRTYQVTGLRVVSNGHWPTNPLNRNSADLPRGTVIDSLAYKTIAFVSVPGKH